jgi:hypothetical protein
MFRIGLGIAASLIAGTAYAHHSGAMYDDQKQVEVSETVKEFQWTNPHSWLAVTYTDPQGQAMTVDLELGSPMQLVRQGWKPKIMAPGDKVTVKFHPHKDGAKTGFLNTVTLPNGTTLTSE